MANVEDLCYSVYCFTNKLNNKKYVGLTCNVQRRYNQHKNTTSRAVVFCLAIKKYGFENFEFLILKENLSLKDAKLFERQFIKDLNSIVPYGYNRTEGGDSSVKHTAETIKKIVEKTKVWRMNNSHPMQGKKHSEESKKLMKESASKRTDRVFGESHWNFGMKHKESTKQKMSSKQSLGNNGNAKKVIDLNTNIIYSCVNEAKVIYGISHSFVSMLCSGKRKSDKYKFKYLKDYEQERSLSLNR